ncbi:Reticulon-like protein [Quillaja saponaria]|uniref:Reticulon-like protein n=1 Tax=Quillaja saponaria TaxID=32244 RepID=A0AAD7QDN6_QUISA|nr:Reticulon-like protein [Quillaja saponaria]
MDMSRRAGTRSSVVAGSVWESRMNEVKGGIKVFNGEENSEEEGTMGTRMKRNQIGGGIASGKRKTWKSESFEGFDKNPFQIARVKSDPEKNSDDQCKELSVSADGIKKSPIQARKLKSEGSKEMGVSVDKFEKSPIPIRRQRSESVKGTSELGKEVIGSRENSMQLKKAKSDLIKTPDQNVKVVEGSFNGIEENPVQLRKAKSESSRVSIDSKKVIDESVGGIDKNPIEVGKTGSDKKCKEFGVCQEKIISSSTDNVDMVESSSKLVNQDDNTYGVVDDEADEADEEEEEIEIIEKTSFDIKEINIPEPEKIVNEVSRFHQINEKPVSVPLTAKQSPPVKRHSRIYQNFSKPNPIPEAAQYHSFPQTQNNLQSLVDLVMWRDVSRSAFVFGIGTFIIISSSYAKDINVSFISVISYLGLVYLAAIFLYRSLICRGFIDVDDTRYVVGEQEAIWVMKLILPYLNEFLSKLRALFSGDPATTMKLAVLLFVLARSGSSITIWKMAKFGFFGIFTVPKVFSLYSAQLSAYAKFWFRRFKDAWDTCSHKKAVTVAIFTLVWNLSSIVARIWAVFMMFVAVKYYQQNLVEDDDGGGSEEAWQAPTGGKRQGSGPGPTTVDVNKVKKGY